MTGHAYLSIQEQYLTEEEYFLFYNPLTPSHVKEELTNRAKIRRSVFNRMFKEDWEHDFYRTNSFIYRIRKKFEFNNITNRRSNASNRENKILQSMRVQIPPHP